MLTVAWISEFPVEWLPDAPASVRQLPRQHPATWQRVLLAELEKMPDLRVHVIAFRKGFDQSLTFERHGVVFHLLKSPRLCRAASLFWIDTWAIRRALKAIRPDVVHAWGTEKGAALVAGRLGYPYVVTIQGLASWLRTVFPLTAYERWISWLERFSLSAAPLITAESRFAAQFVRQLVPQAPARQIEVVPDPLFHRIQRRPQSQPVRIVFNGHLGPRKGGDVLLLALDRLRHTLPCELVVLGSSAADFLRQMQTATSPELWSRIRFKQHLTPEEVAQELAEATWLACPTRADTGPMAVKEAVVAGVPVIGSAVGGIPDYVQPGRNGFLFPVGDLEGCCRALQLAAEHPLFRQGQVEAAALAQLRAYLSPERMAQSFVDAYRCVQAGTTCPPRAGVAAI